MTDFQRRVLEKVAEVPRGRVVTYGGLAKAVGRPRAWRAVANAVASNPHPVNVPCHRVVRSDGKVGGYQFGGARKTKLLLEEGIVMRKGKIERKFFVSF